MNLVAGKIGFVGPKPTVMGAAPHLLGSFVPVRDEIFFVSS
jgi:hypothetical protein